MKKIILCFWVLSMVTGASFAKEIAVPPPIDSKFLNIEYCEKNADMLGYLLTASDACGYEINSGWLNYFTETNKKCIKKFGDKKMYNTTMAAIHEAKNDIANHERGDMCSGIYKAYKSFF